MLSASDYKSCNKSERSGVTAITSALRTDLRGERYAERLEICSSPQVARDILEHNYYSAARSFMSGRTSYSLEENDTESTNGLYMKELGADSLIPP